MFRDDDVGRSEFELEPTFELVLETGESPDVLWADGPIDGGVALFSVEIAVVDRGCLLYTSPSPRDRQKSRMPSSA